MRCNLGRGEDADVHTLGGIVVGIVANRWLYRAQAALQLGRKNGRVLRSRAFDGALTYLAPQTRHRHEWRMSYEFLQGDDPRTATDEQFDLLWGRWPRWSELYVYTFEPEARIAQISNLHRIGPGWTFEPVKNGELAADFYWLFAGQNNRVTPPGFFAAAGKTRGQLLSTVYKHRFGTHLSGHLRGECFFPGNYYGEDHRDTAVYLRAETILSW